MLKKILLLLLLLPLCGTSIKGRESSDYLWPIEKFRDLSSGFGEYRSFHFHSGIDIPTQKKTGYEVLAPESGWVYRIYTSWWGYGKALYVKLEDGRLVLFGHLSEFSAKIKEFAEQKQLQSQSYFLNLFLDENQIKIEKGEVVGYSGETGTGAAHLHFELRDEENQPLNPLTHGFWLEDSTPPVIQGIALRPLGINSFVNGKDEVVILPLIYDSITQNYTLKEAPVLSGRIGLELKAFDKTVGRKLSIYKSSLYLDDQLIFSSRYDTINFDNTRMVELDRDFQLLRQGKGHFYKLYVDSGNDLDLYLAPGPDKGVISTERFCSLSQETFTPGAHRIEISVEDASANLSRAQFSVIFDRKPEIRITGIVKNEEGYQIKGKIIDDDRFSRMEIGTSPLGQLTWAEKTLVNSTKENDFVWQENIKRATLIRFRVVDELGLESDPAYLVLNTQTSRDNPTNGAINLDLDHYFRDGFLKVRLEFDPILRKEPELLLKVGGFEFHPLLIREIDQKSYQAVYPFSEAQTKEVILQAKCESVFGDSATFARRIPLSIASATQGGEALSEDGMARIKIDSGAIYGPIELKIKKNSIRRTSRQKGDIYSFEPKDVPFADYAWVSLSYKGEDCDPERLALYEYKDKSWRFLGNELDSTGKTVSGKVRCLSTYALIEDNKAPNVKIVYPEKGPGIKKTLPEIYAKIWDDLSGFGSEDGITVTVDNLWAIPEYDPEKGILKTRPPQPLSPGWHTLTIVARDRAGNTTSVEREFKVIR